MNNKQVNKSMIVARLTVTFESSKRDMIEIHTDASFAVFFHRYTCTSARKKSPKEIPTHNRNYATDTMATEAGLLGVLDIISTSYQTRKDPVKSHKLVIYKKRMYRNFFSCEPASLPGGCASYGKSKLGSVIRPYNPNAPMKVSRVQERESRIFRKQPTPIRVIAAEVKIPA